MPDLSAEFLKEAAKHFVCLTYLESRNAVSAQRFASCFVIEVEGTWFLVTAGHVIQGVRDAIRRGANLNQFFLHDRTAGHNFDFSLPYDFNERDWIVVEEDPEGTDYAAAPLSMLFTEGLKAGGIKPISERAWGLHEHTAYPVWLLLGVPAESAKTSGAARTLNLTLLPLKPAVAPPNAIVVNRTFAQIASSPRDSALVSDIAGMSGGPIFGVREDAAGLKYWVIGIQSSWFASSRVVSFCPVDVFFLSIKEALVRYAENGAA
jgi:hypothetical protein